MARDARRGESIFVDVHGRMTGKILRLRNNTDLVR